MPVNDRNNVENLKIVNEKPNRDVKKFPNIICINRDARPQQSASGIPFS